MRLSRILAVCILAAAALAVAAPTASAVNPCVPSTPLYDYAMACSAYAEGVAMGAGKTACHEIVWVDCDIIGGPFCDFVECSG